jgi:uncharacterized surface protein with fasciclin (FAS1) repeats
VLSLAAFSGCEKWDDHIAVNDPSLQKNLFESISSDTALSKFSDLLVKSGYDKIIASSKTFTVFAPNNAALSSLDQSIISDTAKLRAFVSNHIATQSYFTRDTATQRVLMLDGKYANLKASTIEDASIVGADKYAMNGVVQVINKMLPVLKNSWETLQSDSRIPAKQKNYVLTLFRKVYDVSNAVQIGVDATTGKPLYQPGTDSATVNLFLRNAADIQDERKQYTFFILNDAAWDSEVTKFKPYVATGTTDSTTDLASWTVVKDLAVEGLYPLDKLPDTLLSTSGVKIGINKSSINQSIKTSNGIIYIMNSLPVLPKHKIKEVIIQGENYRATLSDKRSVTYFRDRYNPLTQKDFRDVLIENHGVSLFNINYRVSNMYSGVKYKASWVALNDFQTQTFNQRLAVGTPTSATMPYVTVAVNNYNEVPIGDFTLPAFQNNLDLYLVSANSTTRTANPLVCDYIRLVPDLQ